MDLENAYYTVDEHGLKQTLKMYEVGGKLLTLVLSFYVDSTACVWVGMDVSERFSVGLRQGYLMSPWLLNVYMDGEVREVK